MAAPLALPNVPTWVIRFFPNGEKLTGWFLELSMCNQKEGFENINIDPTKT